MTRALLLLAAACSHATPAPAPAPSPAPSTDPPSCGAATCTSAEFCENLYKGHATDDEGRPLEHYRCVALPDACRAAPACACVTATVASTHCKVDRGLVMVDDYPH